MLKHLILGALGAAVALGAGSAVADDLRGRQLEHRTDVRAHETGTDANAMTQHGGRMLHGAGGVLVHGTQTAWNGAHSGEYNVRHRDNVRGDQLAARTRLRANQTGRSARTFGHQTVNTTRDTGGVLVHGAQTTGDAVHQGEHNVREGLKR